MSKYLEYAVKTASGFVRSNNEDNFFVNAIYKNQNADEMETCGLADQETNIMAVCDGMGGEEAGEVASYCAVSHIEENWEGDPVEFVRKINRDILQKSEEMGYIRMGSTISFLVQHDEQIILGNIGDSRNYRLHDGELSMTSKDHSKAQLLIDMGLMKEEEAKGSDAWHILVQNLGTAEDEILLVPYLTECSFEAGDQYLLCSDGLSDMISFEEMKDILNSEVSLMEKVQKMENLALASGGMDNITILIAKCMER